MVQLAQKNAMALGAGHRFIVFLGEGYCPVNVLNAIKMVPEICRIFCATANPVEVVVAETDREEDCSAQSTGFLRRGSREAMTSRGGRICFGSLATSCKHRALASRECYGRGQLRAYESRSAKRFLAKAHPGAMQGLSDELASQRSLWVELARWNVNRVSELTRRPAPVQELTRRSALGPVAEAHLPR